MCSTAGMTGFILALLAALIAGVGARDQAIVAAMAERQGPRPAALLAALLCAALSAWAAGWAGTISAPLLAPAALRWLVVLAAGLAALELLLLRPGRKPAEPTASLGAFVIVLLAQQLTDAARLLIFALAATSTVPALATLGGMLGGCLTVVTGWSAGAALGDWPLGKLRRILGCGLILMALLLALQLAL